MWVPKRLRRFRAQGRAGLILIETLRTLTLCLPCADLSAARRRRRRRKSCGPPGDGSQAHRGHRQAPPPAGAGGGEVQPGPRPGAGQAPGQAPPRYPASRPRAVARHPKRPVGGRGPARTWAGRNDRRRSTRRNPSESQLIPLNPGESRPENVSDSVFSPYPSTAWRELRSLAYAPLRARRAVARSVT